MALLSFAGRSCSSSGVVRLASILYSRLGRTNDGVMIFSRPAGKQCCIPAFLVKASFSTNRSTARVLDGHAASKQFKEDVIVEVSNMKSSTGVVPRLAMIVVGDHEDEYVEDTKRACESVGIHFSQVNFSSKIEIIKSILEYNRNPSVHGIVVRLPLNKYADAVDILRSVSIKKDVGGQHPVITSQLASGDEPIFLPCADQGCIELFNYYKIDLRDKKVVVVSSSQGFGTTTSFMLRREGANTVRFDPWNKSTRKTDVILSTKQADIILLAVGKPNLVDSSWIKPGTVVVDFGYNFIPDLKYPESDGHLLVGDVCYDDLSQIASAITPVPGGVGPMAIAMLLCNTVRAAKKSKVGTSYKDSSSR